MNDKDSQDLLEELVNNREILPSRWAQIVKKIFLSKHLLIRSPLRTLTGEMDPWYQVIHTYPNEKSNVRLIGKGVTFDTGGLNLKNDMDNMHFDKAGACLALVLSLRYHIPATVIFARNMPATYENIAGGLIPNSIIESANGKKVFISDTDAEGRLLLADAIEMSEEKHLICLATLTGHAAYFTGDEGGALVHSPIKKVRKALLDAPSGVKLWPAPVRTSYKKAAWECKVKGADIKNYVSGAGSQLAFEFLNFFKKPDQRVHLVDMASEMADNNGNYTGWGLKDMEYLLEQFKVI